MDHDGATRRWPTSAGGLDGQGDWSLIEAVVADLLADLADPGPPVVGEGLLLFYLPFTDLGLHQGGALCWEVNLSRGGPDVSEVGVAEHPLLALGDLPSAVAPALDETGTASPPASGSRRALVEDLQRDWAGWGALLRRAAVIAAKGPASPDEPSVAGFDLDVRWSDAPGRAGWLWQAGGMEVLDEAGESIGVREWTGDTPSAALRAALADAGTWFDPYIQPPPGPPSAGM